MRRVQHATKKVDANGAGKDGFTNGAVGTQTPPTVVDSEWLNDIQEEVVNCITGAGLTLSTARNQLATAIPILAAAAPSANAVSIRGTNVNPSPTPATGHVLQHNGTDYLPGHVTNANVAAAAAIAVSKLAPSSPGNVVGMSGGAVAWVSDTATSIRGSTVAATTPTSGDVIAHNGSQYAPGKITNSHVDAAAAIALTKLSSSGAGVGNILGRFGGVNAWGSPVAHVSGLAAAVNNVAVAGIDSAMFVFLQSASGSFTVSGIAHAVSNPSVDGKILVNLNTSGNMTLQYLNAASSTNNRFINPGGVDLVVPPLQFVLMFSLGGGQWYTQLAM